MGFKLIFTCESVLKFSTNDDLRSIFQLIRNGIRIGGILMVVVRERVVQLWKLQFDAQMPTTTSSF